LISAALLDSGLGNLFIEKGQETAFSVLSSKSTQVGGQDPSRDEFQTGKRYRVIRRETGPVTGFQAGQGDPALSQTFLRSCFLNLYPSFVFLSGIRVPKSPVQ